MASKMRDLCNTIRTEEKVIQFVETRLHLVECQVLELV